MADVVGSDAERYAQGVIELVVPDLGASVRFYTALGFAVERSVPGFVSLQGHGCRLFLAEDASAVTGQRWSNLRVIVDDVDSMWKLARETGCPIHRDLQNRDYGLRDFSVRDPSGFELRFAQPI